MARQRLSSPGNGRYLSRARATYDRSKGTQSGSVPLSKRRWIWVVVTAEMNFVDLNGRGILDNICPQFSIDTPGLLLYFDEEFLSDACNISTNQASFGMRAK